MSKSPLKHTIKQISEYISHITKYARSEKVEKNLFRLSNVNGISPRIWKGDKLLIPKYITKILKKLSMEALATLKYKLIMIGLDIQALITNNSNTFTSLMYENQQGEEMMEKKIKIEKKRQTTEREKLTYISSNIDEELCADTCYSLIKEAKASYKDYKPSFGEKFKDTIKLDIISLMFNLDLDTDLWISDSEEYVKVLRESISSMDPIQMLHTVYNAYMFKLIVICLINAEEGLEGKPMSDFYPFNPEIN